MRVFLRSAVLLAALLTCFGATCSAQDKKPNKKTRPSLEQRLKELDEKIQNLQDHCVNESKSASSKDFCQRSLDELKKRKSLADERQELLAHLTMYAPGIRREAETRIAELTGAKRHAGNRS